MAPSSSWGWTWHKKTPPYRKHHKHESLCLRKTFGHCWNSSIMQWQVPSWVAELKSLRRYKCLQETAWILLGHLTGLGAQDRSCFCIRAIPKEKCCSTDFTQELSHQTSPEWPARFPLANRDCPKPAYPLWPTRAWLESPAQKGSIPEFSPQFTIYLHAVTAGLWGICHLKPPLKLSYFMWIQTLHIQI